MNQENKADMYRRQLGGTNAALNRAKQRVKELEQRNADLERYATWYEQEYEPQARERIEGLESLALSLFKTMNTLFINGHAPTGRQLGHYEQRLRKMGLEGVDE